MRKIIGQKFFGRDTPVVAQDLLGKYIVRKIGTKIYAYKITEVEAYDGPDDKASHASKGRTERTEVMFGEAGRFYVYLVYGMHYMLNVVTDKKSYPAAVLIRGVSGISGPGRVAKKLKISKKLNNKIAIPKSDLWFEDRGERINQNDIKRTPRIGVSYAGPVWSKKPYRFLLKT